MEKDARTFSEESDINSNKNKLILILKIVSLSIALLRTINRTRVSLAFNIIAISIGTISKRLLDS